MSNFEEMRMLQQVIIDCFIDVVKKQSDNCAEELKVQTENFTASAHAQYLI